MFYPLYLKIYNICISQEIPEATDNVMSGHVSVNKEHQTTILESNPIGKVNEQEDHTEGIDVNDSDYLPTTGVFRICCSYYNIIPIFTFFVHRLYYSS